MNSLASELIIIQYTAIFSEPRNVEYSQVVFDIVEVAQIMSSLYHMIEVIGILEHQSVLTALPNQIKVEAREHVSGYL